MGSLTGRFQIGPVHACHSYHGDLPANDPPTRTDLIPIFISRSAPLFSTGRPAKRPQVPGLRAREAHSCEPADCSLCQTARCERG